MNLNIKYLNNLIKIFIPSLISIYSYYIFNTQHTYINMVYPLAIENFTIKIIEGDAATPFLNRKLSPYLVVLISKIGFDLETSYKIFIKIFFLLNSLIFFFIMTSYNLSILKSSLYLILYNFLICSWFGYLYYPWDFLDIIIFLLLSNFILKNKPKSYFIYLFILSLLNGERSILIALFFFFNSVNYDKRIIFSYQNFFISLIMIIFALILVLYFRGYIINTDKMPILIGNELMLFQNIKNFVFINWFNLNFFYSITLVIINIYYAFYFSILNKKQILLYGVFLSQLVMVFMFGVIEEVRVFQFMIPVALLLFISINEKKLSYSS